MYVSTFSGINLEPDNVSARNMMLTQERDMSTFRLFGQDAGQDSYAHLEAALDCPDWACWLVSKAKNLSLHCQRDQACPSHIMNCRLTTHLEAVLSADYHSNIVSEAQFSIQHVDLPILLAKYQKCCCLIDIPQPTQNCRNCCYGRQWGDLLARSLQPKQSRVLLVFEESDI